MHVHTLCMYNYLLERTYLTQAHPLFYKQLAQMEKQNLCNDIVRNLDLEELYTPVWIISEQIT